MRRTLTAALCAFVLAFTLAFAFATPAQAGPALYHRHCSPTTPFGKKLTFLDLSVWVHKGRPGWRYTRPWATPRHTTKRRFLPDVHYRFAYFDKDGKQPRGYQHPLYRKRAGTVHTITAHWKQQGGGEFSCTVRW